MKKIFTSIILDFFKFSKAIGNSDDNSYAFKANSIMTVFIAFNVLTIVAYFRCFLNHNSNLLIPVWQEATVTCLIGFILYQVYVKNNRYEKLFKQVEENNKMKHFKTSWLTISYMILSLAFLVGIIWLPC